MSKQQIPKDYKKTDVGVIPEDWELERIDENLLIKTGSKDTQDRVIDGKYPFFVRSQHVERINSYSYDGEAVLTAGDGVGTGKIFHYIVGKFDVHQRVYRMTDFSNKLNGKYFFYQFSAKFYDRVMSMTAKSSVDSVRKEMIAGMLIPLPTKKEQTVIVTVLSDADELIENLTKLIAKKKKIKQGAMQELLTGKRRLPGFEKEKGYKKTEVSVIPEDWEVNRLGEIKDVGMQKGKGLPKKVITENGKRKCIHYGELFTRYSEKITNIVSRTNSKKAFVLSGENDVLMPTSDVTPNGLATASAIKEKGVVLGGDILIIRLPSNKLDSEYFSYNVNVNHEQVMSLVTGTTVYHLYGSDMKRYIVAYPNKQEQTAIANVLSNMDQEIEALKEKKQKYQQIKKGMMQQLLTGKIRLV